MTHVDVHILRLANERDDWFQYCIESLHREPINLRVIDGIPNSLGEARIKGFSLGTAPYVAVVDPDDLVCHGAFQACLDALEADPNKVVAYTREARISEGGCLIAEWDRALYEPFFGTPEEALRAHHLCVYRRAAMPDLSFLSEYTNIPEMALRKRMWDNNFVFVDRIGYQWRKHSRSTSQDRKQRPRCVENLLYEYSQLWRRVV